MGIFVQFTRHFRDQSYFSVTVIHVQLLSVVLNILGATRNSLKKEDW